jgi:hypothetical protein
VRAAERKRKDAGPRGRGPAPQTFSFASFFQNPYGGTDSRNRSDGAPESWRTDYPGLISGRYDSLGRGRGNVTGPCRYPRVGRTVFRRGLALRVVAILTLLFMVSNGFVGVGDYRQRAAVSAPAGPFSSPVMMNDVKTNDQMNPVLVGTSGNGLFAAWEDTRSDPIYLHEDIYTARSINNCSTFLTNVRADDAATPSDQKAPAVAVSSNGTILLVWQDNRRSTFDYDIFLTKSYDGGLTFAPNVKVNDPTTNLSWQERPSIAVTSGGTIFVAWTDDRAPGHLLRIRGAYSTDWGATFSASKEIVSTSTTGAQDQVSLVANGNRIFAAFMDNVSGVTHPYFCVSTNGGKSFSAPARLDDTGDPGFAQRDVTIAAAPGGGIVAAWDDGRRGIWDWDIYMSSVSSRGVVTIPSIRVDDDTSFSNQSMPSIAADQLGNVYAAWMDERDDLYAIRFAYMIAGSGTFNASVAVSSPGSNDMQRSPSLIAKAPGLVYIAWQDDRANTEDVYCSCAFFPEMFGIPLLDGWNLISIPSDVTGLRASTLGLKNGDVVASWNSSTQRFDHFYIVGVAPPPLDFALSPSCGYWISTGAHEHVKLKGAVPTTVQTKYLNVPLGGGWVLIGFESINATRWASDVPKMVDVPGSITMVTGYDPTVRSYQTYVAALPPSDFLLTPGWGYWCWCTTSTVLTYTP